MRRQSGFVVENTGVTCTLPTPPLPHLPLPGRDWVRLGTVPGSDYQLNSMMIPAKNAPLRIA